MTPTAYWMLFLGILAGGAFVRLWFPRTIVVAGDPAPIVVKRKPTRWIKIIGGDGTSVHLKCNRLCYPDKGSLELHNDDGLVGIFAVGRWSAAYVVEDQKEANKPDDSADETPAGASAAGGSGAEVPRDPAVWDAGERS